MNHLINKSLNNIVLASVLYFVLVILLTISPVYTATYQFIIGNASFYNEYIATSEKADYIIGRLLEDADIDGNYDIPEELAWNGAFGYNINYPRKKNECDPVDEEKCIGTNPTDINDCWKYYGAGVGSSGYCFDQFPRFRFTIPKTSECTYDDGEKTEGCDVSQGYKLIPNFSSEICGLTKLDKHGLQDITVAVPVDQQTNFPNGYRFAMNGFKDGSNAPINISAEQINILSQRFGSISYSNGKPNVFIQVEARDKPIKLCKTGGGGPIGCLEASVDRSVAGKIEGPYLNIFVYTNVDTCFEKVGGGCSDADTCAPPNILNNSLVSICFGGNDNLDNGICYNLNSTATTTLPRPTINQRAYIRVHKNQNGGTYFPKGYTCSSGAQSNGSDFGIKIKLLMDSTGTILYETPYITSRVSNDIDGDGWSDYSTIELSEAMFADLWDNGVISLDIQTGTQSICDNTWFSENFTRYKFKFNQPPTITNITPLGGWSGKENITSPISCNANNPVDISITVQDPDGRDDITGVGIAAGESTLFDSSTNYLNKNDQWLKKLAMNGSSLYITANSSTSGSCTNNLMSMQVLYNDNGTDKILRTFPNVPTGGNRYFLHIPDSVTSPSQIKIKARGDCYNGSGNDSNLVIKRIVLNSTLISSITKVEDGTVSNSYPMYIFTNGNYTLGGTVSFSTGWKQLPYNYDTNTVTGGPNDWRNYIFGYPVGSGIYGDSVASTNPSTLNTCSPASSATACTNTVPLTGDYKCRDSRSSSFCSNPNSGSTGGINLISVSNSTTDPNAKVFTFRVFYYKDVYPSSNPNIYFWIADKYFDSGDRSTDGAGSKVASWNRKGVWNLDFDKPQVSISSFSVINYNTFQAIYSVSDSKSRISYSAPEIALLDSSYTNVSKSINWRLFNGGTMYGQSNASLPSSNPYIQLLTETTIQNSPQNRTLNMNIGDIDQGRMALRVRAVDERCNISDYAESGSSSGNISSAWFMSTGGSVTSMGTIKSPFPNFTSPYYTMPSSSHPEPWNSPYAISSSIVNISNNLILGSSTIQNDTNSGNPVKKYSYSSMVDRRSNIWNSIVADLNRSLTDATRSVNINSHLSLNASNTLSQVDICNTKNPCIVRVNGQLNLSLSNSEFTCDRKATIWANSIVIDGNVKLNTTNLNGCIFVSNTDITISDGAFVTNGGAIPKYDTIQGFFIAKKSIKIEKDTPTGAVAIDGLKVVGSLVGFGLDSAPKGIEILRSLQLQDNVVYPSVFVQYDNRYQVIGEEFFSGDGSISPVIVEEGLR